MRKPLLHTKVTVKLRKSEYREEWYLVVESYPIRKPDGGKPGRIIESVNRIITTPIWDTTFLWSSTQKMVSTKNKSEEKDIKLTVFYIKMVFFSSFCGNLINFVRVLLYNKIQLI